MSDLYMWANRDAGAHSGWVDTEAMQQELIEDGVLVPVEPCRHGRYDPHWHNWVVDDGKYRGAKRTWCKGAGLGGRDR